MSGKKKVPKEEKKKEKGESKEEKKKPKVEPTTNSDDDFEEETKDGDDESTDVDETVSHDLTNWRVAIKDTDFNVLVTAWTTYHDDPTRYVQAKTSWLTRLQSFHMWIETNHSLQCSTEEKVIALRMLMLSRDVVVPDILKKSGKKATDPRCAFSHFQHRLSCYPLISPASLHSRGTVPLPPVATGKSSAVFNINSYESFWESMQNPRRVSDGKKESIIRQEYSEEVPLHRRPWVLIAHSRYKDMIEFSSFVWHLKEHVYQLWKRNKPKTELKRALIQCNHATKLWIKIMSSPLIR
jgi:hypothetical protein